MRSHTKAIRKTLSQHTVPLVLRTVGDTKQRDARTKFMDHMCYYSLYGDWAWTMTKAMQHMGQAATDA